MSTESTDATGTESTGAASTESTVEHRIEKAASTVGSVWPVHSFVTANPLSGFEDVPFEEAVSQAGELLGGRGYPSPDTFRAALEDDRIDRERLESELAERGHEADPEALLERLDAAPDPEPADPAVERVDHVLTKWLAAFLEEGRAEWPMPDREEGFYAAFSAVAEHDGDVPDDGLVADLPDDPLEAVEAALEPYPESQWVPILEEQLAALPGWTGFVKRRADDGGPWQSAHPVTLADYLAVRLALLDAFGVDLAPATGRDGSEPDDAHEIAEAFLTAWEATYRADVLEHVTAESRALAERESSGRPDAQLVFCIDTRSEVIRRHVEAAGDYETHGYAGFFGVPIEHRGYDAEVPTAACPPILDPQHRVPEVPTDRETQARRDRWSGLRETASEVLEAVTSSPATAFAFVEHAGSGYGLALAARTLVPGRVHDLLDRVRDAVPADHEFCDQIVQHQHTRAGDLPVGMTHEEQVEYAATAFESMGWEAFGRLVVFVGHASETANNPYDASLDCGACAGNPGGPNARVLAAICNDEEVRAALRERGIDVPEDTVFLAGEHNTTTDEVELYGDVPQSHEDDLEQLREDLDAARETATAERLADAGGPGDLIDADPSEGGAGDVDANDVDASDGDAGDGDASEGDASDAPSGHTSATSEAERRAADWAEPRPEWGLAGNAGFVVGPRELTSDVDLDGRAFLHSYDWSTDPEGDALEAILTGPMVVTQWINCQYYFSTVDTAVYGSGSKVTQNPVGNVGVYQGNGGDLVTGLPLQSVKAAADEPYHQPLRLSTVVHAPVERVADVLADHEDLLELLDNDWLSLAVVDPTQDHRAFRYEEDLEWTPVFEPEAARPAVAEAPAVADD